MNPLLIRFLTFFWITLILAIAYFDLDRFSTATKAKAYFQDVFQNYSCYQNDEIPKILKIGGVYGCFRYGYFYPNCADAPKELNYSLNNSLS